MNWLKKHFANLSIRGGQIDNQWVDAHQHWHMAAFWLLIVLLGVRMYHLNALTPFVADDFNLYKVAYSMHSISDWTTWLYQCYLGWGGRIWGNFLALHLYLMPEALAKFINTLVYLAMILLMYVNIVGRFKISISLLLFANVSLWLFLPAFGQDVFWLAGCTNYMWLSLGMLAFLALYRWYDQSPVALLDHPVSYPVVFVLGMMAGWASEHMAVAVLWVVAGYLLRFHHRYGKKMPVFSLVGAAGAAIGALCIWMAPGNFVRFASDAYSKDSFVMVRRVFVNGWDMLNIEHGLVLCFLLVLLLLFGKSKNKALSLLFASGAIVGAMALGPVGSIGARYILDSILFLTISVGVCYTDIFQDAQGRKVRLILAGFLLLGMHSLYGIARIGIHDYRDQWAVTEQIIQNEKAKGNLDIVVNPIVPKNKYCAAYGLENITSHSDHSMNRYIAEYYRIHSIKSIYIKE